MVSQTGHLEGLKWEVLVVNEPVINAFCLPGGKIVVFTGLLNHFRADAEIATVIGHEVGHVVARHSAEQISKNLWLTILQLILYQFFMPDIVNTMSNLFLRLPFSRRMEMEADYIGLLLVASAGYDPRVAPKSTRSWEESQGVRHCKIILPLILLGRRELKFLLKLKSWKRPSPYTGRYKRDEESRVSFNFLSILKATVVSSIQTSLVIN
ncbi:UNVERIFIED_CONTAM: Mitochondrial metalloendopeptidase OMA1 [Sesamum calycinum]|uniref:Mitochondrial metalloendopeptidase OMA1 n=1 Tax=Sesamum calycinum TaxID=2727403 RepID=A0AAW2RQS4_9LAMI